MLTTWDGILLTDSGSSRNYSKQGINSGRGMASRNEQEEEPATDIEHRGQLKFFDDVKRYGFVTSEDGSDFFVHETEIRALPYHRRVPGVSVTFRVIQDPRSLGKVMAAGVGLIV